jgi:hypothetical protein
MLHSVEEEPACAPGVGLQPGRTGARRGRKVSLEELLALDDVGVGVDGAV